MKKLGLLLILSLVMTGCAGSGKATKDKGKKATTETAKIKKEKENGKQKYKVIVLDPAFESWYETTWSPATDHSKSYYHSWNQRYVTEWNYKATHPGYSSFFDNTINYQFNVDYGLKVERKLYYYFRWVETQLKIPILDYNQPRNIY